MKREEKLRILEKFLNKYNLSLNDEEVKEFLFTERKTYDDKVNYNRTHKVGTGVIAPNMTNILPIYFENSGYSHSKNRLIDWFMYENADANSFVFDNIGKFKFDIVGSFENTKKVYPIVCDNEGNYFNYGDGNHRLLTLILQHFVERTNAKTKQEMAKIDAKYNLNIPVSYLHQKKLIDMLEDEKYELSSGKKTSSYSYMARKYREQMLGEEDILATYDDKRKIYNYNYNGQIFKGTDRELMSFLINKEDKKTLQWQHKGINYVAGENYVIKTKDDSLYKRKCKEMEKYMKDMNIKKEAFLVIKDIDKDLYEIIVPQISIDKLENKKVYMDYFKNEMFSNIGTIIEKKSDTNLKDLKHEFDTYKYPGPLYINETKYINLTKEQYEKVYPLVKKQCELAKKLNNKVKK